MLKNSFRLVLFDRLGHHIENIMHDCSSQLEIIVGFNTLLCDRLRDTFAIATFKLTRKQIA
jgi:hypothetical protein